MEVEQIDTNPEGATESPMQVATRNYFGRPSNYRDRTEEYIQVYFQDLSPELMHIRDRADIVSLALRPNEILKVIQKMGLVRVNGKASPKDKLQDYIGEDRATIIDFDLKDQVSVLTFSTTFRKWIRSNGLQNALQILEEKVLAVNYTEGGRGHWT